MVFKTVKPVLCALKKPVLAALISGVKTARRIACRNVFYWILEAKLIAFATQIL